jgi:maltose alpha-D-glucosyltransferase / alpha-amylase
MPRPRPASRERPPAAPDWYKDAVIYEVPVRAFRDSNGDGIGDFPGLTEKLDYLVDLGVTALWLLPFFPSPGRDDGYDTADYTGVHPDYGTLADVRTFLAEAHRRGLRVIGELVLNHTSDQHAWFQRARRAPPGSPWREYYVWSDSPDRYRDARIIFTDTETSNWAWDPVAGAYYWHRFFSHQPDLNYENPRVRQEMLAVVDHWLDLGLDGLRLDAVPYLYEEDGTSCENLEATHEFLRELRRHVDERYGDRMLLAEANQWPEDAVAYLGAGSGDECHMAFHFPLMPRIFMALRTEDRFPIVDILEQTPPIPATAQWAIFLRNHDELTLEMVTDEERDYMYRAYASDPAARINVGIRRRLAPLAETRRRLELLYGLLLSLPGTPVLYYGDEIGMGDNFYLGDRNAVRTPMQWSPDRNAGFSEGNRQRLYLPLVLDPEYHFEAVNVAVQQANPSSLLWWMKRVIGLRRRHPAMARGTFEVVATPNRHVIAYRREHDGESILVVANLSRYAQWFELDLARDAGRRVVELFGGGDFPAITTAPYALSLGPHTFLWLRLEPVEEEAGAPAVVAADDGQDLATLLEPGAVRGTPVARAFARWLEVHPAHRLPDAISSSTRLEHVEALDLPGREVALILVRADTRAGEGISVPFAVELVRDPAAPPSPGIATASPIVTIRARGTREGFWRLVDVSSDPQVAGTLGKLATVDRPRTRAEGRRTGRPAALHGGRGARRDVGEAAPAPIVRLVGRADPAPLPEVTTAHGLLTAGAPIEPLLGSLEADVDGRSLTVGYVVAAPDADLATFADEATGSLDLLLAAAVAASETPAGGPFVGATVLAALSGEGPPALIVGQGAEIMASARQVGMALAGLHDALARPGGTPPAPYTALDRRALYQGARTLLGEAVGALRDPTLPPGTPDGGPHPEALVAARSAIDARLRLVIGRSLDGMRIPRYGGPVTASRILRDRGRHVIGIPDPDFRPAVDRTRLRSPLLDVAAILASLRTIALRPLFGGDAERRGLRPEDAPRTEGWARTWWAHVGAALVAGYLAALSRPALLPSSDDDRALLLDVLFADLALEEILGATRAAQAPDPAALVALLDLAGASPGNAAT